MSAQGSCLNCVICTSLAGHSQQIEVIDLIGHMLQDLVA